MLISLTINNKNKPMSALRFEPGPFKTERERSTNWAIKHLVVCQDCFTGNQWHVTHWFSLEVVYLWSFLRQTPIDMQANRKKVDSNVNDSYGNISYKTDVWLNTGAIYHCFKIWAQIKYLYAQGHRDWNLCPTSL
jgi:hypothetical protein